MPTPIEPAAQSPFLPDSNRQFAWDSTSLGWFKECPRKYFYSMIRGLRSHGESVHLRFGILYHSALETYDKHRANGADHEIALRLVVHRALIDTWDNRNADGSGGHPWDSTHNLKTRFTLIRSIIWYLEEFEHDNATTVHLANGQPAVELSFRFEVANGLFLSGHLDRVVNFQGATYVMDRKTTSTTPGAYYFDGYSPDNQMSLYSLAGQIILNAPVRGVIIDACQIAVGFTRFSRGMVYRTPAQLEEWLSDFYYHVEAAHDCADRDYWPLNDKSCNAYGGCPFRKICAKDPAVREAFLETDFVVNHWNPLEPR